MRLKNLIFVFLFVLAGFFVALDSFGDSIYLKNKNVLKGIIKEEDDKNVTIDVGIGKFTVSKDEIESIERAGDEEKEELLKDFRKKDIERGVFVPPGLEDIANKFEELKIDKEKVDLARSRSASFKDESAKQKSKFDKLVLNLDKKSKELKNLNPRQNTYHYNNLVSEINSLNAELVMQSNELKKLNEKYFEYNKKLHGTITSYKDDLDRLKSFYEKRLRLSKEKKLTEDEAYFYNNIYNELVSFENSFRKDMIRLSKYEGGLFVVEVKLNGTTNCLMAVDTGANVVSISKDIADRLGLDLSSAQGDSEAILADGSRVKTKIIYLSSVEVGDSRVENVLASVLANPPGPGVDGLLGMSFLSNFSVRIDSVNSKLILETLQ